MKKCALYIVLGCAGACMLPVCGPWLVTFAWHFTHHDPANLGDYSFPIPGSFMISRSESGLRMRRVRFVGGSRFYTLDELRVDSSERQPDLLRWKNQVFEAIKNKGYEDVLETTYSLGGTPLECIERKQNDKYISWAVLCRTSDGLLVQYSGASSEAKEPGEIFASVSRK